MDLGPASSSTTSLTSAPLFESLTTLAKSWRLQPRSATLDGSIALRAAQACVPFLEGNAYGSMVASQESITLVRRWGGWRVDASRANLRWAAEHRALWPLVQQCGEMHLARSWQPTFAQAPWHIHGNRLLLWTGIWLRHSPDLSLRISNCTNRRNRHFDVVSQWSRADGWQPLVLALALPKQGRTVSIHGEVASLLPVCRQTRIRELGPAALAPLAERHCAFFDATYFHDKQRGPTRRYKRITATVASGVTGEFEGQPELQVVSLVDPPEYRWLGASSGDEPHHLQIHAATTIDANFDGQVVHLRCPLAALRHRSERVAATLRACSSQVAAALAEHAGAHLYFGNYVLHHQSGEPHFFAKPAALFAGQGDRLALVEGIHGPAYDVMRGVLRPDVFGAMPIVMDMHDDSRAVRIEQGTPLATILPIRATWLGASHREIAGEEIGWPNLVDPARTSPGSAKISQAGAREADQV